MQHRPAGSSPRGHLTNARPSAEFRRVRQWGVGALSDMAGVRRGLRRELLDLRTPPRLANPESTESILLVASELLTNAVLHGGPHTTLCLRSDGQGCVLDITDSAPDRTPRVDRARPLGAGGFGLVLALELALEVGWYSTPTRKHVWASFGAESI